jgi:hypothetical protein
MPLITRDVKHYKERQLVVTRLREASSEWSEADAD